MSVSPSVILLQKIGRFSLFTNWLKFSDNLQIAWFDKLTLTYILFSSKVWRNLKKFFTMSERLVYLILRVSYIFILRPSSIGRGEHYKNGNIIYFIGRRWETAESHRNCRIFIFFFFTRKICFLFTSNLFVLKAEYFLIKFWCPFSNVIIGFEKLLNLVNKSSGKNLKISISSPKSWFL